MEPDMNAEKGKAGTNKFAIQCFSATSALNISKSEITVSMSEMNLSVSEIEVSI